MITWRIIQYLAGMLVFMLAVDAAKEGWYYCAAGLAYIALDFQGGSRWPE